MSATCGSGRGAVCPQEAGQRVALPPPGWLGELEDDESGGAAERSLEVRQLWGGDSVLDVKVFRPDHGPVRLGEDGRADFRMPAESLPVGDLAIAHLEAGRVLLSLPPGANGELRPGDGRAVALAELRRSAAAGRDGAGAGCGLLPLEPGATATIAFGDVAFRLRRVSRPAGYLSRLSEKLDLAFLNVMLLVLFAGAALVATFHLRPASVDSAAGELHRVPDRFVQFILSRPEPEPRDLRILARLEADIAAGQARSAPRPRGAQGAMGRRGEPATGERSAQRAGARDDEAVVERTALLRALGPGGPPGLAAVTGGKGLGDALEGAIGELDGARRTSSGGFVGLGPKGSGPGGGAAAIIGSGPLRTRGRAGGRPGYGPAGPQARQRGERGIDIAVGRPIVVGTLSMDIIRRVIHGHRDQIRYCYARELTRQPDLSGKLTVKFTISTAGYVQQAAVSANALHHAALERCILQKVRSWKFPEPRGGIVIVNYPFILRPR